MYILSIDTSSATLSVAVQDEGKVLAYSAEEMSRGVGEALIPTVSKILATARLTMQDIGGIAVAIGPGSFTGVRVGLSAARGMGLALGIPVYGVTNFEAVAYGVLKPIIVVLDTKRGDYYTQSFDANGNPIEQPVLRTADQLKELLPFTAMGDGAIDVQSKIECEVTEKISPGAVSVGRVAFSRLDNPLPPEPLYLRDADVTV